jgi:hypothetical protein
MPDNQVPMAIKRKKAGMGNVNKAATDKASHQRPRSKSHHESNAPPSNQTGYDQIAPAKAQGSQRWVDPGASKAIKARPAKTTHGNNEAACRLCRQNKRTLLHNGAGSLGGEVMGFYPKRPAESRHP